MEKILVKEFLPLWNDLLNIEHESDRSFSLRLGLTPAAISHWRTGITKTIHPKILAEIERLGYNVGRAPSGRWEIIELPPSRGKAEGTSPQSQAKKGRSSYPLILRMLVEGNDFRIEPLRDVKAPVGMDFATAYWVEVKDDSMFPRYSDGDFVLVHADIEPTTGEFAAVRYKGNENLLVRRVFIRGKNIALAPLNPTFDAIPLDRDEIVFWAPVVYAQSGRE
jgi:SOS-response transcriptional repressor LexA